MPRIIIRPPTALFIVLLLIFDQSKLALMPTIAAIVHELGHIIIMRICGVNISQIEITLFGADIRSLGGCISPVKRAAVYFAGAGANLIVSLIIFLIPNRSFEAEFFALCSLTLAILNLLPIRTLDGGCILDVFFSLIAPMRSVVLLDFISAATLLALWLTAVYLLLLSGANLSLLLFCAYLFAQLYLY